MTESIPLALAIAASPFAIIPAIMLLLTPRPRAASGSFLAAWFLGVGAATGIAVAIADVAEEYATSPSWTAWLRIALAVALGILAARTWLGRKSNAKQPAWMAAIAQATPRRAFGLGIVLSVANPKVLALALAGGVAIGAQATPYSLEAAQVIGFAAIASVSVAVPLVAYAVLGERAMPALDRVRLWLELHANALMATILAVLAVVLALGGLAALTKRG